jgi:hypothetical protein
VRIDKTHRGWAIATALLILLATLIYVFAVSRHVSGAFGGTWAGLLFGTAGLALIIFHNLLSLRKKIPTWRIGRTQTWMRAHLWLGILLIPLVLYHASFTLGGRISNVAFWLTATVIISGIFGAALQHVLPRLMTQRVPFETIYDQIDRVQGQLLTEADELIGGVESEAAKNGLLLFKAEGTGATAVAESEIAAPFAELRSVYQDRIRPFLQRRGDYGNPLYQRRNAKGMFFRLRKLVPAEVHEVLDDLENICEEKRDLDRQSRMHRVLHGWLLVHVPLSYALLAVVLIHAIVALRYM